MPLWSKNEPPEPTRRLSLPVAISAQRSHSSSTPDVLHLLPDRIANISSARGRKQNRRPDADSQPGRKTYSIAEGVVGRLNHCFTPVHQLRSTIGSFVDQSRNAFRSSIYLRRILIQDAGRGLHHRFIKFVHTKPSFLIRRICYPKDPR